MSGPGDRRGRIDRLHTAGWRDPARFAGRRALVLAPQPFYEDRGTPIALAHVLGSLSRLRVQADVVTFPVGEDIGLPGLEIVRPGPRFGIRSVPVGLSGRKLLFDLSLTAQALRLARRGRYDAIYAIEETVLPALLLGRWFGLPVIYDMQSSMPEQLRATPVLRTRAVQAAMRRVERWFVRSASVVACSAGLEGLVRELDPGAVVESWRYPGARPRIHDADRAVLRADLGIPADAPVVYYGGTFENYQGIGSLVAAIPRVLEAVPEAVFVLVGATRGSGTSAQLPPGVPARSCRLLPRLPRDEAVRYLALADVAVSPRVSGLNLPLKVIDYMCAGKAIVATDHPAHRTVLDETRALLVAPDARSIAAGVVALVRDRGRAAELARGAREYAAECFALGEFDAQVSRILAAAFADPPRGGARAPARATAPT